MGQLGLVRSVDVLEQRLARLEALVPSLVGVDSGSRRAEDSTLPLCAGTRAMRSCVTPPSESTRRSMSGARGVAEQPLHDHAVAPFAVELRVASIHADLAKAEGATESQARGVLGEDAADELPMTAPLALVDQPLERRSPIAPSASYTRRDRYG